MKIAVIGAGIIGITTAFELALDGHEVTVLERQSAAAEGTSFANAGVIAPGYVTPWAAPRMPRKVLRHLMSQHAPVKLAWPLSTRDVSWMWRWLRACKPDTFARNRERMLRLALYSRERLDEVTSGLGLEYDRSAGYMVLLRSEADRALAQPGLSVLREAGQKFREIDADAARQIEPALSTDSSLVGAIYLEDAEASNCRQFAMLLKADAQRRGVTFEFNCTVDKISATQPGTLYLAGEPSPRSFDGIVLCAGTGSADLLRPLGVHLPMTSIYGYSLSASIREPLNAPRGAVMDERYKVAITRLGQRVRVAGSADIGGRPGQPREAAIQTLYKVLHDWFPGAANISAGVQVWKGARPMMADGPPVLGASGIPGVWLNLGHGSSGWALSCGSARAVADLIDQRTPAVNLEGLGLDRLQNR